MSVLVHIKYADDRTGTLKFELYIDECPKACKNFLALCASDFYDGVHFHRNIKGFLLQGGDPTYPKSTKGKGG